MLSCQFLVLTGNRFWFYLLCTYVLRVQYSCGVVLVFWFWREIVFGVTYCRRPPRYVLYKGTFVPYDGTYGTPDQGQTLDV